MKKELFKFLKWCALVLTGLLIGFTGAWLLEKGYKWPAGILGTLALLVMAYGYNGWCGHCCAVYDRR